MVKTSEATYLELFVRVTKAITSSLDLDEVFELITRKMPEILHVDAATIRLLDESGKNLILKSAHGLSQAYLNRGPVDSKEPILRALKGEPILIQDAPEDPRIQYREATRQEGIKSIIVVPIPIQGQIQGVLKLLAKSSHTYSQQDIDFVTALAEQCGIAIENARAHEEQQTQLAYFKALREIEKAINATHELDQVFDLIVTRLPAVMDLKAATIRLIESGKRELELKAAYGLSQAYLERGPLDEELATYYVKQGDPVIIPDAKVDVHTLYHKEAESEGICSVLAVPITAQDDTIGMLRLLTAQVRNFSEADINFAMTVAEQCGVAIQTAIDHRQTDTE